MFLYILILLILIELNLFNGWFLALWIVGLTFHIIGWIIDIIKAIVEM